MTAWRFRKLALAATVQFEHALETVARQALAAKSTPTREAVLRQQPPSPTRSPSSVERFTAACNRVTKQAGDIIDGIRSGVIQIGEDQDPVQRSQGIVMLKALTDAQRALERIATAIRMTSLAAARTCRSRRAHRRSR